MRSIRLVVVCAAVSTVVGPAVAENYARLRGKDLDGFAAGYLGAFWDFHPFRAAGAGLHEFDGVLPDRRAPAIRDWVRFNQDAARQLMGINRESLRPDKKVDFDILKYTMGAELIEFDELKVHNRNPMVYDVSWGLLNLIRRNYAPLEVRIKAATKLLEATPRAFEQARTNLDEVLPQVFCKVAISNLKGSADFIRTDLVQAFASVKNDDARAAFETAAKRAARAVDEFVAHLKSEKVPRANDAFAIGERVFGKMLRDTEGIDISLSTLLALGHDDLQRNLTRARTVAEKHFGGKSVKEVMGMMKSRAYTADMLIPSIASELDEIRRFCLDRNIISIPSEVRPIVAETPKFARWATAMMSTPGPFEKVATEAYYDVTPVDSQWTADEQRQWLADFNRYVATNVSVHEAYPGHYVQFLHTNRAGSDVQKALTSYAAVEGWAHYAEQMMIEAGFHADDPMYEMAQIQDALLRNCRFVCSIRMHTQGMSVDQATKFFMENAFTEELPSRREAERGTFDPAYLKYTLGKLAILKLREDYRKKAGELFSLKRFHDELLSRGMPPISVTRERMLGPNNGPSF